MPRSKRIPLIHRPSIMVRIVKRTDYTEQEPVTTSYLNYTEHDVIVRDTIGFTHRIKSDRGQYGPTGARTRVGTSLQGEYTPKQGQFLVIRSYNLSILPRDERMFSVWYLLNGEALSGELRQRITSYQNVLNDGGYDVVFYYIVDDSTLDINRHITLSDTDVMIYRDTGKDEFYPHPFSDRGIVEYFNGNISNIGGNGLTFKLVYAKNTKDPKIVYYRFLGKLYRLEGELDTGLSAGVHLLIKKSGDNITDCLGGDDGYDIQFSESELNNTNGFYQTIEEATSTTANPDIIIQDLKQQLKTAKAKASEDAAESNKALDSAKEKYNDALNALRKQNEVLKAEIDLKTRMIDVEKESTARMKEEINSAKRREEDLQSEINRLRADNEKTHKQFRDYVDDNHKEQRRAEQEKRDAKKGFMDSLGNVLKVLVGVITAAGSIMSIYLGLKAGRVA